MEWDQNKAEALSRKQQHEKALLDKDVELTRQREELAKVKGESEVQRQELERVTYEKEADLKRHLSELDKIGSICGLGVARSFIL